MALEYVVDFVGHGIIECGDDPQPHATQTGQIHVSLGAHCNERAHAGWRLITVIGSTAGPLLFFEREAHRLERT